jgi:amino acid adenylation domain-containing protein/thioester reductase-like protein
MDKKNKHLFPLTSTQERMWYLQQLHPNQSVYNMSMTIDFDGELDVDVLEQTIKTIFAKHALLRVNFIYQNNQVWQFLHNREVTLLKNIDKPIGIEVLVQQAKKFVQHKFDLYQDNLFRCCLLKEREKFHTLILCMHHIVADGWSLGIISQDLQEYYSSLKQGVKIQGKQEDATYFDYVAFETKLRAPSLSTIATEFWRDMLCYIPPHLHFPKVKNDAASKGVKYYRDLPPDLVEALELGASKLKVTPYMVLLSVYLITLFRFTLQADIMVGMPFANRKKKQFKDVVGLFVNSLFLRARLSSETSFSEILASVKRQLITLQEQQDVPLDKLVEAFPSSRREDGKDIFNVMFVLQNTPFSTISLPGLTTEFSDIHNEQSKYDMVVTAIKVEKTYKLSVECPSSIPESYVSSFIDSFQRLLRLVFDKPDVAITQFCLTPASELNAYRSGKKAVVPVKINATIPMRFRQIVKQHGTRVALGYQNQQMSYHELDRRSDSFSHIISQHCDSVENPIIAVLMQPTMDLVTVLLAILKSGKAYLPIDPSYPEERIRYLIQQSKVKTIVVDNFGQAKLEAQTHSITRINVDTVDWPTVEESAVTLKACDLAYVIYTSGSTGQPKGVKVTHENVLSMFAAGQSYYHYDECDVWSMLHSYAFDFSVWEIWGALLHGAKLVIFDDAEKVIPKNFVAKLKAERVTLLSQTPTSFKHLTLSNTMRDSFQDLALKYIVLGGEKICFNELKKWPLVKKNTTTKLVNMYGITEITVHATLKEIQDHEIGVECSLIGLPMEDMSIYLLDEALDPVPVGAVGEMYVGGAGVAQGYFCQDTLTQERFIADPFTGLGRLYKTGDLALFDASSFHYVSRMDNQIKVRGFRVELEEIRSAILKHPSIADAYVSLQETENGQSVAAYLTLNYEATRLAYLQQYESSQVKAWTSVFDTSYQKGQCDNATFNTSGWNSSYTNQAVSLDEMSDWLDLVVSRILHLKPKNILEIGCGTGLLLFQLTRCCESYTGIDPSKIAISGIKDTIRRQQPADVKNLVLHHVSADRYDPSEGEYDCAIINSVVQYFPDIQYLTTLITKLYKNLSDQGCIFLGDIRSFNLRDEFWLDLELFIAKGGVRINELKRHLDRRKKLERELLIDYNYFYKLASLFEGACVLPICKHSHFENEMSKFRYDVYLFKNRQGKSIDIQYETLDVLETDVQKIVRSVLKAKVVGIKGYPNVHTYQLTKQLETIRYGGSCLNQQDTFDRKKMETIERQLAQLSDRYKLVVIRVPGDNNCYVDLYIIPEDAVESALLEIAHLQHSNVSCGLDELANHPFLLDYENDLTQDLTDLISRSLPAYMLPDNYFLLECFPITVNGKLDVAALPQNDHDNLLTPYEAPVTEIEKLLTGIMEKLLKVPSIGRNDNFFHLGGHSILAATLVMELSAQLGEDVALNGLIECPVVKDFAVRLSDKHVSDNVTQIAQLIDNDMRLIQRKKCADYRGGLVKPETILLTGANGFLGRYVLFYLIKNTDSQLICLIRSDTDVDAYQKLVDALQAFNLWENTFSARLSVVQGDLEKPRLGLSKQVYDRLLPEVDTIIHNGANVNFSLPYDSLREANVLATQRLLEFAELGAVRAFHYISSLFVFNVEGNAGGVEVHEQCLPENIHQLSLAYLQTKAVSEHLVSSARSEQLFTNIYRIGRISGDSQTGACQEKDFLWGFVRSCLNAKAFPDIDLSINTTPVDDVACLIVSMVHHPTANRHYHICNETNFSYQLLLNAIKRSGYPFNLMPFETWLDYISSHTPKLDRDASIIQIFKNLQRNDTAACFNKDNTLSHSKKYALQTHAVNEALLKRYIDYFTKTKYLQLDVVE